METYKYNSVVMAKYIVAFANERQISINVTKIQKLLYIFYGLYLAVKNVHLINEHPQAWPYGPVFPTTRNKLVKMNLYSITMDDAELDNIKQDVSINKLATLVFNTFGSWSANQLSEWSHQEGSPWQHTISAQDFKWGEPIDDELIKSYFKTIIIW